MKAKTMKTLAVAIVMACSLGCAVDTPQEPVERQEQALFFWLPFFVQWSFDLVGHGLNGVDLNGQAEAHLVVAVSLEAVELENGPPKDLMLKRTQFHKSKGKKTKQKTIHGKTIEGARFMAYLEDGSEITLRIDEVVPSVDAPEAYLRYAVSYEGANDWLPLCGVDDTDAPILAIPLNGTWEYQQGITGGGAWTPNDGLFTFACEGYVLAKCVALGYPPWSEGEICDTEADGDCVETTLASRHQACARAMRADYCGDGISYTEDNILLNIYDGIGIRADAEDWSIEAEWDADGALCVDASRVVALPAPTCIEDLMLPDCGDPTHFEEGTLLITEVAGPDDTP